jgi:hypothetical protein
MYVCVCVYVYVYVHACSCGPNFFLPYATKNINLENVRSIIRHGEWMSNVRSRLIYPLSQFGVRGHGTGAPQPASATHGFISDYEKPGTTDYTTINTIFRHSWWSTCMFATQNDLLHLTWPLRCRDSLSLLMCEFVHCTLYVISAHDVWESKEPKSWRIMYIYV